MGTAYSHTILVQALFTQKHMTRLLQHILPMFYLVSLTLNRVATEAFGGYIKILGSPVSRKRDMTKVKTWADTLDKKFSEEQ